MIYSGEPNRDHFFPFTAGHRLGRTRNFLVYLQRFIKVYKSKQVN